MNNHLNVLFSSDDNYAQHLGAAIYSLLEHNKNFEKIYIFVIDNEIQKENKNKLTDIVKKFQNAEIRWISFKMWKNKLHLNMAWKISISAYARLFVSTVLPEDIDRVLYLDCDMIVCRSLKILWNYNLEGKVLGAVQDTISDETKRAVGLGTRDSYFNSGMLLIDLKMWRKQNIENQCMQFISEHSNQVIHHDQGVLNGVLKYNWTRVPISNNLMTIHFLFSRAKVMRYYGEHSVFYSEQAINAAVKCPTILHYTPSFTCRPWIRGCCHPLKNYYWNALAHTPWMNAIEQKNTTKWYIRLIDWRYRKLPY